VGCQVKTHEWWDTNIMNKFAEKLKEQRVEKGLLQKDVAKHLNVIANTVSMWECGDNEPSFDTLIKIAKFFNVSTDYLLGLED
jgi:transcriptional regulator with XRE-family HTH domain